MKPILLLIPALLGLTLTGTGHLQAAPELDRTKVEALFDKEWADSIRQGGKVPGAIVTVVQSGQVLLNKGYGMRDSATGEPVDPDNTRVRIGSTSKLFTTLTVLSLVDEGKLSLDQDVNTYLTQVQVPATFDSPVTVRTLLSHLSGFDSSISGYMVPHHNDTGIDFEEYGRRLRRLRAPGTEYGYDNMGLGLLGYLSGEVNHSSFPDAVEQRVLGPLGLTKTAMGVPDRQLKHLGACHTWDKDGNPQQCQHKFMREVFMGAGDISTTGSDMGQFMLALLDGTCLHGHCILTPGTNEQFTDMDMNRLHPLAKGMGFILHEKDQAGRHSIGHDGGQDGFSTSMTLFPDSQIGIFISVFSYPGIPSDDALSTTMDTMSRSGLVNTYGTSEAAVTRFAETFLPVTANHRQPKPGTFTPDNLSMLDGVYADTRRIGSALLTRMMQAFGVVRVTATADEVWIAGQGPYVQTGNGVLSLAGSDLQWLYTQKGANIFLQHSMGSAVSMLVKKPWHHDARWVVFPLVFALLMAVPALLYGMASRAQPAGRRLGYLVFFTGLALALGLYLEFEYFGASYYPSGGGAALFGWRLLLNAGWLAALTSLYLLTSQRKVLVSFTGLAASARSLLLVLMALASLSVVILLPYWGIIGNLWD